MTIPEHIKKSVENTVGYAEAANKNSFSVGAGVAFRKAEEYFKGVNQYQQQQLEYYKKAYENTLADLKLITNTIKKYQYD